MSIPFSIYKRKLAKLSQICNYWIISKGLKEEFETAVVNESSVFQPPKFYCSIFVRDLGDILSAKQSSSCASLY